MAASSSEALKELENGTVESVKAQAIDTNNRPLTPPEVGSDGDEERTARERLKKTSIAGLAQQSKESSQHGSDHPLSQSTTLEQEPESNNGSRGRPAKKRSFEDLARDDADTTEGNAVGQPPSPKSGHHKRMRSRDMASGEHHPTHSRFNKDAAGTLHEESDVEAQQTPGGPGVFIDAPSQEETEKVRDQQAMHTEDGSTAEASDPINHKTPSSNTTESIFKSTAQSKAPSGFANISSTSPFGNAQSKSPQKSGGEEPKATSSSAFASSGLSAFASSEKSPFGAAGGSSVLSGGFGGPASTGGFGSSSGGFAGASAFGAKSSSGFGSGGGFAASSGFGSVLGAPKPFGSSSGFGSSNAPRAFGAGKPFGAASKDDEEEGSEMGEDDNEAKHDDEDQQDPRFHEQHLDTGEEDEETLFACRAKLYHFEKEWKERGVGTLKVNIRYSEEAIDVSTQSTNKADDNTEPNFSATRRKARLLMRADGVHRVILNSPVFKGMKFGDVDGAQPTGKTMHLQGLEEGKPRGYQVKIGKEEVLKELFFRLRELEAEAI